MARQSKTVSLRFKRQIRFDRLSNLQRDMAVLGSVGEDSVERRLARGQNTNDVAAKPLGKRYAILKTRLGLSNKRDLFFTGKVFGNRLKRPGFKRSTPGGKLRNVGHLLEAFTPTRVGNDRVILGVTTYAGRIKALKNERRESWMKFSPRNQREVAEAWRKIYQEKIERLMKVVSIRPAGAQ